MLVVEQTILLSKGVDEIDYDQPPLAEIDLVWKLHHRMLGDHGPVRANHICVVCRVPD